ncbi:MAG: hypothetical protein RL434_320 [Pseudomonadota bacterium]|jgi:hypothetical protein
MNPAELPLRDSTLPPPLIAWWPLAPGWWLILAVIVTIAAGLLIWFHRRRRTRLRRFALARLAVLRTAYAGTRDAHALAADLSMLCRQVLLVSRQGHDLQSVTGDALLAALDALVPGQAFFTDGPGRSLLDAPYDPGSAFDAPAVLQGMEHWLAQLPPHAGALRLRDA